MSDDILLYLLFASALLVGFVAARHGRNGWKWGILTFFAALIAVMLPVVWKADSLLKLTLLLPILVGVVAHRSGRNALGWGITALIVAGMTSGICVLAGLQPLSHGHIQPLDALILVTVSGAMLLRLWVIYKRNGGRPLRERLNAKFLLKRKTLVPVSTLVFVLVIASFAPLLLELHQIDVTKKEYYLDEAVNNEVINDSVHKPTWEQALNPEFLKKYDLSMAEYETAEGYFLPNGIHWLKWSLKTKIAATLMFAGKEKPTNWKIRKTIHMVDAYYQDNDKTIPVVKVINALMKLQQH